ncbi:MAG TPA: lysozyme [Pseudonocardiaceae bacterium]|nr:lysozyme [Pseudonocardiaceae bacterium]
MAVVTALAAATTALCPGAPTAAAAPATKTAKAAGQSSAQLAAQARVTHPQDDYAGAQIARHEDTGPAPAGIAAPPPGQLAGLDVSNYQGNVAWPTVVGGAGQFAYIKATEGVDYISPSFNSQYTGAYAAGLVRGAYHFATPNTSSGAAQADYFVAHGGGWTADGRTLPPAVDLEYNPYGDACYGMTPAALVGWIHDFATELHNRTGRFPTIYTSTSWWTQCTGNNNGFGATSALWIPRYGPVIGALPAGWTTQVIWQYADSGAFPGDQDYFNGSPAQLRQFALG